MPKYWVPYVRRYLEPLWWEHHHSGDASDRAIEAAVHWLLDLSITIEAATQDAAITQVENMFPGHVVVRGGIKEI